MWGHSFGENNQEELKQYFNSGIKINFVTSIVIVLLLIVFKTQSVGIFTKDTELISMTVNALPIWVLSFIFMALNLIYTAYFYSTKQTLKSDIVAINRGVILKALLIFSIPQIFGIVYIWHSVLVAEILAFLICLICKRQEKFNQ